MCINRVSGCISRSGGGTDAYHRVEVGSRVRGAGNEFGRWDWIGAPRKKMVLRTGVREGWKRLWRRLERFGIPSVSLKEGNQRVSRPVLPPFERTARRRASQMVIGYWLMNRDLGRWWGKAAARRLAQNKKLIRKPCPIANLLFVAEVFTKTPFCVTTAVFVRKELFEFNYSELNS